MGLKSTSSSASTYPPGPPAPGKPSVSSRFSLEFQFSFGFRPGEGNKANQDKSQHAGKVVNAHGAIQDFGVGNCFWLHNPQIIN